MAPVAAEELQLPHADPQQPIVITGVRALRWQEGVFEVLLLDGGSEIRQGQRRLQASGGVVWIQRAPPYGSAPHKVIAYLEGVSCRQEGAAGEASEFRLEADNWLGRLYSSDSVVYQCAIVDHEPDPRPEIYQRAMLRRDPSRDKTVQLAQFVQPGEAPVLTDGNAPPATTGQRRIRMFPRSNVPMQASSFVSPDGRERISVFDSGVNIVIDGVPMLGTIDIAADRIIVWSPVGTGRSPDEAGAESGQQAQEFYLEGNIVFRQADRVIYANSMYYNVTQEMGVILDAELLTPVPEYEGVLRLKASVLRQIDRQRFQGHQASLTTSRLGVPRYWFQTEELYFEDRQLAVTDPAGGPPALDPITGEPVVGHQRRAQSRNNLIYVAGIPVFYWPRLNTDLTQPTTYVTQLRFGNDRIFGTQIGGTVDMHQILGISDRFPTSDWTASVDYLSERGWGLGTHLDYELDQVFGIPGPTFGRLDAWGLPRDNGLDNLGQDRRAIPPEKRTRGRLWWQHRQRTLNGWQVTGELGIISDRNFLENYYEREWDEWKDQSTDLEFKRLVENMSWDLFLAGRINPFFTETEWLPRLDHIQLGQSFWHDRLTWYGHSQIAYARLREASRPTDPTDAANWNPLPWEANVEGIRAGGRHELDWPIQAGAVRIVPYVLGDVMIWGETLTGTNVTRAYGQAGIRASLPMTRVDPTVRNQLFNLTGLAHKIEFESEFLWADANQDLAQFPLYDQLNDNSTEHFLRRFVDSTFGGMPNMDDTVPLRFDERFYALRYGMQSWVTAKSAEIADDLMLWRLQTKQRWQTKRGPPHEQRIIDWMTLDAQATLFPQPDRDNFGSTVGLINYDWRWHVGDRVTLMSDGYADVFADGLKILTVGGYLSRPERGSAFLGFRSITGPFDASLINAAWNYRMSPKWIASTGLQIDLGPTGNTVQLYELTRVGESFLITVGARANKGRDNLAIGFTVEPRFLPLTYRGTVGNRPLLPAGVYGLE